MACSHQQNIKVVVTANTNLCPNCYNEYRLFDSISFEQDCPSYIPDFGKKKIDNGCVFHDTLFLLINVNHTDTYFNEEHQDSTVRIYTETANVGIDKNLDIEGVYPFRFRDLKFNDFSVNAWQDCAFFNVAPVTTNLRPANR